MVGVATYVEDLCIGDVVLLPMPIGASEVIGAPIRITRSIPSPGKKRRRYEYTFIRVELDSCTLECTQLMVFDVC